MKHTDLPWGTVGDGYSISTTDRKALYIAQTHPFDPMGKANAEYIVRACNAFPGMEKALKTTQKALIEHGQLDHIWTPSLEAIEAALAAMGE